MPVVQRFPRWRVWWRILDATETTLGSVPVVLAVPTFSALVGTALAVSHPADVIRHGLVVHQASFGSALLWAVIGGAGSLFLILVAIFAAHITRYWLRGDPVWEVGWSMRRERKGSISSTTNGIQLLCRAVPPVKTSVLGHVEAVVRLPDGTYVYTKQPAGIQGDDRSQSLGFIAVGEITAGIYEVRWYGTNARRRQYEITRDRHTLVETAHGIGPAPH